MPNREGSSPSGTFFRRYDKGERRYKHVGKDALPVIQFHSDDPKCWIGKCPRNLSADDHAMLLNEAIPGDNGDRDVDFPKKLYTVHEGAIYEAQTTDRGYSYHGYPYRGRMPSSLLDKLRDVADRKGCRKQFDAWRKKHIEPHGGGHESD